MSIFLIHILIIIVVVRVKISRFFFLRVPIIIELAYRGKKNEPERQVRYKLTIIRLTLILCRFDIKLASLVSFYIEVGGRGLTSELLKYTHSFDLFYTIHRV